MTPHITPTRRHVQNDLNAETTGNIKKALSSRSYVAISMYPLGTRLHLVFVLVYICDNFLSLLTYPKAFQSD